MDIQNLLKKEQDRLLKAYPDMIIIAKNNQLQYTCDGANFIVHFTDEGALSYLSYKSKDIDKYVSDDKKNLWAFEMGKDYIVERNISDLFEAVPLHVNSSTYFQRGMLDAYGKWLSQWLQENCNRTLYIKYDGWGWACTPHFTLDSFNAELYDANTLYEWEYLKNVKLNDSRYTNIRIPGDADFNLVTTSLVEPATITYEREELDKDTNENVRMITPKQKACLTGYQKNLKEVGLSLDDLTMAQASKMVAFWFEQGKKQNNNKSTEIPNLDTDFEIEP